MSLGRPQRVTLDVFLLIKLFSDLLYSVDCVGQVSHEARAAISIDMFIRRWRC